jgi:hypothetical protein
MHKEFNDKLCQGRKKVIKKKSADFKLGQNLKIILTKNISQAIS